MRACPAGPPVKAHAPVHSRFSTSGFWPSPREDIGATKGAKPMTAMPGVHPRKALGVPFLVGTDGVSHRLVPIELKQTGEYNEAWLQGLIHAHPEILPVSQIEPGFAALIPAAREVACGHGYIDNLFVTPAGDIVLVETKLWRNGEARREVIAQALDYVSARSCQSNANSSPLGGPRHMRRSA